MENGAKLDLCVKAKSALGLYENNLWSGIVLLKLFRR